MAGADEDFGSEVRSWTNVLTYLPFKLQLLIQLSMIHMNQMILSEPSIIIIWTYQGKMEWSSRSKTD
jgi:hypothetical protein